MAKPPVLKSRHLAELFRKHDTARSARERRCKAMNEELARKIGDREYLAEWNLPGSSEPIIMAPTGPAKGFKENKSLAGWEEYRNVGTHWKRVVDMGCHKESNPRAIGKYLKPETVIVTTPSGVVSPRYHNQSGDPLADMVLHKERTTARQYRAQKRAFRKVIDGLTADAIGMPRVHTESLQDANEKTTGDYRRYFR